MAMRILEKNLPSVQEAEGADGAEVSILDLGGGAGAYSFPLAKKGYKVTLADLSEALLDLIDSTAEDKSIIEMSGHAMYVGRKSVMPVI